MVGAGYELVVDDRFDRLDEGVWLPCHLPQWSSRAQARARYRAGSGLRLRIEEDQPPWCPEFDGQVRVSSLQTGVFAGPVGSRAGQHRFSADAVVREPQPATRLFTPRYGRFEMQARAPADPRCMVALWMIGFEDDRDGRAPVRRSHDRRRLRHRGRPRRRAGPARLRRRLDAGRRDVPGDGRVVRTVGQSPGYPMQVMLGIYEFPDGGPAGTYPKEFAVDWFRAYRPARPTAPPTA